MFLLQVLKEKDSELSQRAENLETFVKKHLSKFSSFDAAPGTFLPLIFFLRAAVKEQRNALFTYSTVISRNKRMH